MDTNELGQVVENDLKEIFDENDLNKYSQLINEIVNELTELPLMVDNERLLKLRMLLKYNTIVEKYNNEIKTSISNILINYKTVCLCENWYMVWNKDWFWFLNKKWELLVDTKYDYIFTERGYFINTRKKKNQWAYNLKWELILETIYDHVFYLKDRWLVAIKDNKWAIFDLNWKLLLDFKYKYIFLEEFKMEEYDNEYILVKSNKWLWIIDLNYNELLEAKFNDIEYNERYWFKVKVNKKDKEYYWVFDKKWKLLFEPKYNYVSFDWENFTLSELKDIIKRTTTDINWKIISEEDIQYGFMD